jgi:histidine triad (HIT) family protein
MSEYTENVFTKIIVGEIPCHRLYEDEHVLAFLDVGPISPGHTLIVPKERATHLHDLSEEAAAALGRVLPRICRAVATAVGAQAYNVLVNTGPQAGQVVMHAHLHVIPKFEHTGLKSKWESNQLDNDDAKELAAKIQAELG